jgi:hypothetical protein
VHKQQVQKRKKVVNWIAMMIKQARKHKVQGGYSKYGLCMNTAYRNLGQFTAQRKNCHLMKL